MSDPDVLLNDAGYRRRWLLSKALKEDIPLAKALELAQAAEEFLVGTASPAAAPDWLIQLEVPRANDGGGDERKEVAAAAGVFDGLSSVVTMDDVLRYLKDSGETVVQETGDKFLVNGCYSENADELLGRANRIRMRESLPQFALVPGPGNNTTVARDKSPAPGKAAAKRPPSARERAEWAKQALGFSA